MACWVRSTRPSGEKVRLARREQEQRVSTEPRKTSFGAQKALFVRALFGSIAHRYDCLNHLISLGMHRWWRRVALRECALLPGMTVLDVGAGTADMALRMAGQVGPTGRVVAIDFCEPMLRVGAAKVAARGLEGRVHLVAGDALEIPLADQTVDASLSAFVLRNIPDVPRALREMTRVVRPGGRVVSLELSWPPCAFWRRAYAGYLRTVLPLVGGLFRHREAYAYVFQSLCEFPSVEVLSEMMREAGLEEVRALRLMGGVVTVHSGRRVQVAA